jgi:molecular chaperone DnaJ
VIEEIEHEELRREGENLHYDAYVNFVDAVLGASLEVPTVGGKVKIKMDAGTQSGKVLRLRGKGVPSVQGYATGDLFVHLHVYTPTAVSKEERELLEKLHTSPNFDPQQAQKDKGFFSRMRDMFS